MGYVVFIDEYKNSGWYFKDLNSACKKFLDLQQNGFTAHIF